MFEPDRCDQSAAGESRSRGGEEGQTRAGGEVSIQGFQLLGARPGLSPLPLILTSRAHTSGCLSPSPTLRSVSVSLSGAGNAKNTSDLSEPGVTDGGVRRNTDQAGGEERRGETSELIYSQKNETPHIVPQRCP